jgi:hypothetical protein
LQIVIEMEEAAESKFRLLEEKAPPPEPKFVMFRTMNIKFLDPSGLASSPVSDAMEWEPTTPVDPDRVIPDS